VTPDRWNALDGFTPARVALGRVGGSLPTAARLQLRLDHARARTGVHCPFDAAMLATDLDEAGLRSHVVTSRAATRAEFIRRPDLGRSLDDRTVAVIGGLVDGPSDLAVVLCDGLSPGAVQRHGAALAVAIVEQLSGWSVGPAVVVTNGRVAIGDQVGAALGAGAVVVLIGARPGMSVPESIGAYVTHGPRVGRTDAERNCVSNIHADGLSIDDAATRIAELLERIRAIGASGVTGLD
jgi:ethanolamine ammonia-lyase small subunit